VTSAGDRPLRVVTVDADPVFRWGLAAALEGDSGIAIVAQLESLAAAWDYLQPPAGTAPPDLVVLEPRSGDPTEAADASLQRCRQLKRDFPRIPVLLLSAIAESRWLAAAQACGIEGYCRKGSSAATLAAAMREAAAGRPYWSQAQLEGLPPSANWLYRQRRSGVRQIDAELAGVRLRLSDPRLRLPDWLFWQGVQRELLAARWLIGQLLPLETGGATPEPPRPALQSGERPSTGDTEPQDAAQIAIAATLERVRAGTANATDRPLEIELLTPERRRELLYTVLKRLEAQLAELRFLELAPEQLPEAQSRLLRELWQNSLLHFFGKYHPNRTPTGDPPSFDLILQNAARVERDILERLPLVSELFAYLLFEQPPTFERVDASQTPPTPQQRAELLLQNLTIQVGNGVMHAIANTFSETDAVVKALYRREFWSSRAIGRFRNSLSWQYRQDYYLSEPRAIFESKYRLLAFGPNGIQTVEIYGRRQAELAQLRGIRWGVTLAWEIRDALAPRVRAIASFIGGGAVYVLTQILGRGLGLIVRGIIQQAGSALQEARQRRSQEQEQQK